MARQVRRRNGWNRGTLFILVGSCWFVLVAGNEGVGQEVVGDRTAAVKPALEPPLGSGNTEGRVGSLGDVSLPEDEGLPAEAATVGRRSLVELLRQANPMLWPLAVCSIVTLGFTLERLVALRRARILPREFTERLMDRLATGKIDRERALELCRANDCVLARVFARVVNHWGQSTATLQEIADREVAGEVQDLKRNVRVLNGTATLAPLLGLLGTVVGLIEAFDALSGESSGGVGKNEALAHGISLALIATAVGLAIAIVSVVFYYVLQHRVDTIGRALEIQTNRLIDHIAGDAVATGYAELRR